MLRLNKADLNEGKKCYFAASVILKVDNNLSQMS